METKYYTYVEPGEDGVTPVYHTISTDEILKSYGPYWYSAMKKKYGEEIVKCNFNDSDCIEDWVVVNWAWESTADGKES